MYTLVLVFVSGFKLILPMPDNITDDQKCLKEGLEVAHYINLNVSQTSPVVNAPPVDKVKIVHCSRNA